MKPALFRKVTFLLYLIVMLAATAVILSAAFDTGKTVSVYDREDVMHRKAVVIPATLRVNDPVWGDIEVADKAVVYEVSDLLQQILLTEAAEDASPRRGGMLGKITYISGRESSFCIDENFWIDGVPYGKSNSFYPIKRIESLLRMQAYTLKNLTALLERSGSAIFLNDEALEKSKRVKFAQLLNGLPEVKSGGELSNARAEKGGAQWRLLAESGSCRLAMFGFQNGLIEVYDVSGGSGSILSVMDTAGKCGQLLYA